MKLRETIPQLDTDEIYLLLPSNADNISIGILLKAL